MSRHDHRVGPVHGNGLAAEGPAGIGVLNDRAAGGDENDGEQRMSAHPLFCTLTMRAVNV
jgi:hypothetical protein